MTDIIRVELEYPINCSPKVLFNRLSTASGLNEWFADDVIVRNEKFTFVWGQSEQTAKLVSKIDDKSVKFRWEDKEDDTKNWFEFRISKDELTRDIMLIITDFCEEDEFEETEDLWNSQISELKHILGSA